MINLNKHFLLSILLVIFNTISNAQNRNSVWCFGDSAGINFTNLNNPFPIVTGFDTRGSCASISDSSGILQFYANTRAGLQGNTTRIWSNNNQLMQNGDSIFGRGWYNEIVIVPAPGNDSIFYVFTCGVTSFYGLYYSIVNIKANNGLGVVMQKNIQIESIPIADCLNAIKHGNGRDWWLVYRSGLYPNNEFREIEITPNGISNTIQILTGSINNTSLCKISFTNFGNKFVFTNYIGLIELYDFDRCTGMISNPFLVHPQDNGSPYHFFWGSEFSTSSNQLYVTISDQVSYLFQFDLTVPNIWNSIDTLWVSSYPGEAIGGLKRGPDGKIYESGPDTSPQTFIYPYPDTLYTIYNMNLGVINSPDNLGAACDFQPYSFYLGGKRTYWGLPNNPDYELGPLAGSPCDTLVSLNEFTQEIHEELFVYYSPNWNTAFINVQKINENNYDLNIIDITGKVIFNETGRLTPPYFTKNLNCTNFAKGLYIVEFISGKNKLMKKFIIE